MIPPNESDFLGCEINGRVACRSGQSCLFCMTTIRSPSLHGFQTDRASHIDRGDAEARAADDLSLGRAGRVAQCCIERGSGAPSSSRIPGPDRQTGRAPRRHTLALDRQKGAGRLRRDFSNPVILVSDTSSATARRALLAWPCPGFLRAISRYVSAKRSCWGKKARRT